MNFPKTNNKVALTIGGSQYSVKVFASSVKLKKKLDLVWENSFNIKISADMWKQIFRVCFKTLKDNVLTWMQYKVRIQQNSGHKQVFVQN